MNSKKEEGNLLYREQKYGPAVELYMAALCGFEFGSKLTGEEKESVERDLKAPILNNIALCQMKQ